MWHLCRDIKVLGVFGAGAPVPRCPAQPKHDEAHAFLRSKGGGQKRLDYWYWCWFSDIWMAYTHKFYNLLRSSLGVTSLKKGTVASKDLSSMAPQAVLAFVWVPWRWKWQCFEIGAPCYGQSHFRSYEQLMFSGFMCFLCMYRVYRDWCHQPDGQGCVTIPCFFPGRGSPSHYHPCGWHCLNINHPPVRKWKLLRVRFNFDG